MDTMAGWYTLPVLGLPSLPWYTRPDIRPWYRRQLVAHGSTVSDEKSLGSSFPLCLGEGEEEASPRVVSVREEGEENKQEPPVRP